jgi:hypothetical protein
MSGHRRFCAAAALLAAGLSPSPASSNPFADLFNFASGEAPAPAPAKEECLLRPGKSTAEGQHWVYRLDGHRKCWFQAEAGAVVKKPALHHAPKQRVAAPEEKEATPRKKEIVDARAELLRSAPAETAQPTPAATEFKVVDAAAVPGTGAAALVPPPVVPEPETNQLTPNHPTPSHVDVDLLLAAAPAASDAVVEPPSNPSSVPAAETANDWQRWTSTVLGVLLMGLGLAFLLSSRTLWGLSPPMRKNSPSSPARDNIVDTTALQDPIAFLNVLAKASPKEKVERRYIASQPIHRRRPGRL